MGQAILGNDFANNTIRGANTLTRIQSDRSTFVPLLSINGGYTLLNGKQTTISTLTNPAAIVAADGKIWTAATGSTASRVYNVDTNAQLDTTALQQGQHFQATYSTSSILSNQEHGPVWLAYDGSKWYFDLKRDKASVYSTSSGGKKASGGGTRGFTGIEYSANGYIWMVDSGGDLVWRFDMGGGASDASISIGAGADKLGATCYDGKYVWIADNTSTGANTQRIWAINTLTSTVYQIKYGPGSAANDQTTNLCWDGSCIWQAGNGKLNISRIVESQIGGTNLTIDLTTIGSYAVLQFCFAGRYMFASTTGAQVLKFDVHTLALVDTITLGTAPTYMAFDGTSLWVGDATDNTLTKLLV